jgi:hypothetical protein
MSTPRGTVLNAERTDVFSFERRGRGNEGEIVSVSEWKTQLKADLSTES